MEIILKTGNVLDQKADVLIATANPMLNMSGGVNGAILSRGGQNIQKELKEYLRKTNCKWVKEGSVVQTSPGPLVVKYILHAVSINGFYESSIELVSKTIIKAFSMASDLKANTVTMPSLATGYGPLSIKEFAQALKIATTQKYLSINKLFLILRKNTDIIIVKDILFGNHHAKDEFKNEN